MPHDINEHGVLLEPDEMVVCARKGVRIVVTTGQHPETGLWAWGFRLDVGHFVHSGWGVHVPVRARHAVHRTKAEAEAEALDAIAASIRRYNETYCPEEGLTRLLDQAMNALEGSRQLGLPLAS